MSISTSGYNSFTSSRVGTPANFRKIHSEMLAKRGALSPLLDAIRQTGYAVAARIENGLHFLVVIEPGGTLKRPDIPIRIGTIAVTAEEAALVAGVPQ